MISTGLSHPVAAVWGSQRDLGMAIRWYKTKFGQRYIMVQPTLRDLNNLLAWRYKFSLHQPGCLQIGDF